MVYVASKSPEAVGMTFLTTSLPTVPEYSVSTSRLSSPPRTLRPSLRSVVAVNSDEKPSSVLISRAGSGAPYSAGSMSCQPGVSGSWT
jgi:hypothetical protein